MVDLNTVDLDTGRLDRGQWHAEKKEAEQNSPGIREPEVLTNACVEWECSGN